MSLGEIAKIWCARHGMVLAQYATPERRERLQHMLKLKRDRRLMQNPAEACQLICTLQATRHIDGDIAEVGTALGGSARLIAEYAGGRKIHLFDTFDGLPTPGVNDCGFVEGAYKSSVEDVQRYLKGFQVQCYKGMFPESATALRTDLRFSFVHLDVDLYQSTLDSLSFFYQRLNPGGVLISHDYVTALGVNKAFAEFFRDKPERPIELIGYQVMVVKLAS
jgi:O-methyltransferase